MTPVQGEDLANAGLFEHPHQKLPTVDFCHVSSSFAGSIRFPPLTKVGEGRGV
jgi:hypothetical protein